jgi:hypothetical protein
VANPEYIFRRTPAFRRAFDNLSGEDQEAARKVFREVFRENPFHPSLNTHKINRLSALARRTIYSVTIKGNLKAVFYLDGQTVVSMDIGTHDIYK